MPVSIDIAVMCSMYQKRLCWMLSSILQQKGDIPKIVFSVAYPVNEGGITTEAVCSLFRSKGLEIREQRYPSPKDVNRRGIVRNRQIADTDCEWILFADCDMVYDDTFFSDLGSQLEGRLGKMSDRCMTAGRRSLDIPHCINFFNNVDKREYPCVVEDVAKEVSTWPVWQVAMPLPGAGYFQLVHVDHLRRNLGGLYVREDDCADWSWEKRWSRMRSDRQFRIRMGGLEKLVPVNTRPQWHLNHERDKDVGKHITIQR
jgi:hypothetical protein